MASKTISIDLEAYERMTRVRRHARESFSQIIRRAVWADSGKTGQRLLDLIASSKPASEEEIAHFEAAQENDFPPDDPWQLSYGPVKK
ncbi:MAG: hypothetical protein NTW21_39390 [Verrucomicrobia bacterium]|nr:hypothetical protein [Verrucomicrobiota bacterium]